MDLLVWFIKILYIEKLTKNRTLSYYIKNSLSFSFVASNALRDKIKKEAVVVDPAGAILISVYIIIAWILQANSKYCLFSFNYKAF